MMNGKAFRIGLLIVSCAALVFCSTVFASEYDHEIKIQKIDFSWKIDGANIHIRLSARTKGWVGIGFNPSEMMKDAKFVLGYVKDGKPSVSDEFGTGITNHQPVEKLGGKSDISDVSGKEEGGTTTIEFTIPLVPTDSKGKKIDPNTMTTVLLAYGPDFDTFRMKHKFRTKISVDLSTGKYSQ